MLPSLRSASQGEGPELPLAEWMGVDCARRGSGRPAGAQRPRLSQWTSVKSPSNLPADSQASPHHHSLGEGHGCSCGWRAPGRTCTFPDVWPHRPCGLQSGHDLCSPDSGRCLHRLCAPLTAGAGRGGLGLLRHTLPLGLWLSLTSKDSVTGSREEKENPGPHDQKIASGVCLLGDTFWSRPGKTQVSQEDGLQFRRVSKKQEQGLKFKHGPGTRVRRAKAGHSPSVVGDSEWSVTNPAVCTVPPSLGGLRWKGVKGQGSGVSGRRPWWGPHPPFPSALVLVSTNPQPLQGHPHLCRAWAGSQAQTPETLTIIFFDL